MSTEPPYVTRVDFENGEPSVVHMAFTMQQLALIYRFTGHVTSKAVAEAMGDVTWGNALDDVAMGVVEVINTYYENGCDDLAPRSLNPRVGPLPETDANVPPERPS